jgi:signal transduction histidine kinase
VNDSDGNIVAAIIITLDITENVASSATLHDLSKSLITLQEDERAHLSRELHDEVSQQLAALNMKLHAMKSAVDDPVELAACMSQVDELAHTVKNLSAELGPRSWTISAWLRPCAGFSQGRCSVRGMESRSTRISTSAICRWL